MPNTDDSTPTPGPHKRRLTIEELEVVLTRSLDVETEILPDGKVMAWIDDSPKEAGPTPSSPKPEPSITTAKPWPHEWREGMRLPAVPGMHPALRVYYVPAKRAELYCVSRGGALCSPDPSDPRIQPDLGDDGTVGHLKGMVREAAEDIWYALELEVVPGIVPRWREPYTGTLHRREGPAYVAALDYLAKGATFHGGGFVGSTADDEVSVTLAPPEVS